MTPNATAVRRARPVGLVLGALGALGVLLAFTVLEWFSGTGVTSGDGSTFGGVHDLLTSVRRVPGSGVEARGVPVQYFGWLGWSLLVLVVLTAVLALVPNPAAAACRIAGPVVALAAIALTFVAIDLVSVSAGVAEQTGSTPTYSEYLEHAGAGFYAALAGFTLAGVAAVVGTRRGPDVL